MAESGPKRETPTIVWFRRDLRIDDNPALAMAAREGGGCVLPIFIWCPEEEAQFCPGRASRWWLKHSLSHLQQSLTSLGSPLLFIRAESSIGAVLQCVRATGATRLFFNHLYDPVSLVRDHNVKKKLVEIDINVQTFNGDLLHEPWDVYDENGHAFTLFDMFWKKCMTMPIEPTFLPPWKLVPPAGIEQIHSCSIDELQLEFEKEKLSNALLCRGWSPGWSNAEKVLNEFIGGPLLSYAKNQMKLESTTTSLLSPYLHFGEISVRKVYQMVRMKQIQWLRECYSDAQDSADHFLRSLGLREYSRYLCFNFPFTHERPLMGNLRHYPWRVDVDEFKCWRQGRTGFPLVDAGMRELWATGWIHNRIRVIVASFCVKYLLLPWTWGVKYFWDTLLDSDLETDILGWQYVSGSLPDGHKLERLDSPEVQGSRFDPDGEYVRHWIPELARVPSEWIHHPWDAPRGVLEAAGVELGSNYPKPLVQVTAAKERLHDAVATMWVVDKANRAERFDAVEEIVADNLSAMENFEIPKVVVKRELSCASSALDQMVPSARRDSGGPSKVCKQGSLEVNVRRRGVGKSEEDLRSTAESTSSRKRCYSETQYVVPMASSSSSEFDYMSYGESLKGKSWKDCHSVYPWLVAEEEKLCKNKEEDDGDTESTVEVTKPFKR